METKIWRIKALGNRGKRMLNAMVFSPFIMIFAMLASSVLVAFICIFCDIESSSKIIQWAVILIPLITLVVSAIVPRLRVVRTKNAQHIFALDSDGILWYFSYSNPFFRDYYRKKHTDKDEIKGLSAFLCVYFFRKFMLDLIRVIYFCEKVQLIEQILSSKEKVQDLFGYKIIGVEKLKYNGIRATVTFTADSKVLNKTNTFTINISNYEDLPGLVKELEKVKSRTY